MQPGPTSSETSPPPSAPPAAEAGESAAAEPEADAEKAPDAVKVETPASPPPPPPEAVQEEQEQAEEEPKEERRGGRRRKRARRGAAASASPAPSAPPAATAAAAPGVGRGAVMVKRDLLARCLTCPLCHRLLRDATTISECLHTFCRKCICDKFNDEEVECCPVCNRNLGCTPVEKLRADHSLQDVRSKLFPFKRKKVKAEEVPSPDSLPAKRKERSISSLVVNTPKVRPTSLTGRRTRAVARKAAAALRGLGPVIDDQVKKEVDSCDNQSQNSVLPASSGKAPQTRRQISSNAETSNYSSNKNVEDDSEELTDKGELWQPLNCLVEAANRTKSFRSSSHNAVVKGEQINGSTSSTYANKTKAREHLKKSKTEDDNKDVPMSPPIMLKKKAVTGRRRRQAQAPAEPKPDAAETHNEKKFRSIWFSLVAFDQQGDPPLPQIPSHYLRIKDGNVPASSIQKYLMQKLSLPNESEVEIKCCEEPVNPTQPLFKLVELWLKGRSAQTTQAMIGSSAKDFVMVLTYGRPKAPAL